MAYPAPSIASVNGRVIRIAHQTDAPGSPKTYLTAAVAAAGVTLTVADNGGLADTNLLRIGRFGSETCEIVSVGAAVTHGTSLTVTALTFAHDPGEPVERVLWDQWKIYGNTTNTTTGATLVATVDQTPDDDYTVYVNTGGTEYAYYFALGYDSVNASTSDAYSDGVASSGYGETAVGSLVERALRETGTTRSDRLTDRWFLDQLNDFSKAVRRRLKTWSFLQCFGYALGQTARGENEFSLPTDIDDANSPKSILNVYLDNHDDPLTYADREDVISDYGEYVQTLVTTQAVAGDTSLYIDNSYGYADSGSVNVYISGTQYTLTYTGVTRSATAGALTGVPASGTGAITVTTPADTKVWQDEDEGAPAAFDVSDGKLRIWPLPDASYDNLNLRMDYYTARTAVDSMGDTLDTKAYDMALHWLKWKVRGSLGATAVDDLTDPDYLQYRDILENEVRREVSGQRRRFKPQLNRITY